MSIFGYARVKSIVGGFSATGLVGLAASFYKKNKYADCQDRRVVFSHETQKRNHEDSSDDVSHKSSLNGESRHGGDNLKPDQAPKYSKEDLKNPQEWPEVHHGREWAKEYQPYLPKPAHTDLRSLVEQ